MKDNINDWQFVAAQLRQPNGDFATEIGERMNLSNQQIHQFTFDELALHPEQEVLEIGMGNGHFVRELFNRCPEIIYTGIDYSKEMVEASRNNNAELCRQNKAQFLHCAIDELPYSEPIYDRIFTINTLYFWSQPDTTLSTIKRLLKTGGLLTIAIRPKHIMEHHPFTAYGFTLYSKEDVCRLLEKNSFEIMTVTEKKESPATGISDEALTFESLIITAKKQ
ncbi:MAG: class I SAM-dependent methyltransferase [Chitinophagaceae bacterium]